MRHQSRQRLKNTVLATRLEFSKDLKVAIAYIPHTSEFEMPRYNDQPVVITSTSEVCTSLKHDTS